MELIKALISESYPGTNGSHLCIKHIAPIQFPHSIKLPVVIIEQMLLIQYLKEVSCVWLPDAQVILEEVVVLCTHLFPLPDGPRRPTSFPFSIAKFTSFDA